MNAVVLATRSSTPQQEHASSTTKNAITKNISCSSSKSSTTSNNSSCSSSKPTTSNNSSCASSKPTTSNTIVETNAPHAIVQPHQNDVLGGRGAIIQSHPGNFYYRKLIRSQKLEYVNARPPFKKLIILEIVKAVKSQSPPGRFLKLDPKTELYHCISLEEAKKKTGQALREDAPKLKQITLIKTIMADRHGLSPTSPQELGASMTSMASPTAPQFLNADLERAVEEIRIRRRQNLIADGAGDMRIRMPPLVPMQPSSHDAEEEYINNIMNANRAHLHLNRGMPSFSSFLAPPSLQDNALGMHQYPASSPLEEAMFQTLEEGMFQTQRTRPSLYSSIPAAAPAGRQHTVAFTQDYCDEYLSTPELLQLAAATKAARERILRKRGASYDDDSYTTRNADLGSCIKKARSWR